MKAIIISISVITLVFIGIFVCIKINDHIKSQPICTKSHTEIRHRKAYTTFIYTGKVMIPITHPARDVEVTICDEYTPRS